MKTIDASDLGIVPKKDYYEKIPDILQNLVNFLRYNEAINEKDDNTKKIRENICDAVVALDMLHQDCYWLWGYMTFSTHPTHHICNDKRVVGYPTALCSMCRVHNTFDNFWLDDKLDVPYLQMILRIANDKTGH